MPTIAPDPWLMVSAIPSWSGRLSSVEPGDGQHVLFQDRARLGPVGCKESVSVARRSLSIPSRLDNVARSILTTPSRRPARLIVIVSEICDKGLPRRFFSKAPSALAYVRTTSSSARVPRRLLRGFRAPLASFVSLCLAWTRRHLDPSALTQPSSLKDVHV
ncbi:hypothetical protein LX32DRAFT_68696 [Colletotrichum zoysiae]|uniref:Uncharacterized protein n=1 Tax=Colletotrichum zoysiae TaxID=1216348 RepID=A0AAD9HAA1_9PEZI|nr:hypothetical protein LX32DRAFT_68696 [Colletotrichum zoysiae]